MRLNEKKRKRKNYKISELPFPVVLLGIQYICLNMGQAFHLGPINLSWISSVLLLSGYLYYNHGFVRFPENRHIRRICFWFLFWAIYALLQIFIVKDRRLFFNFYIILITNILTSLMTLLIIQRKEDLLFALNAFSFSFALNLLVAGIEYFTGRHLVSYNSSYRNQVVGFIGNFNDFCTFLFIAVVIFLVSFFLTKRKHFKIFYIICVAACIFFINYNGARGAIYSLYILFVFWILLLLLRIFVKKEKTYNRVLFVLSILAFALSILWILKYGFYNALALLDNSGGGDIWSDRSRVVLITSGMEQLVKSFGFGIGAGQSTLLHGINLHNFYAEVFSEFGIVFGIFSVFLSFFVFVRKREHINQMVDSLLQSAGFAFLIANVTSSSVNKMRALWIYFMIVVLIKDTDLLFEE